MWRLISQLIAIAINFSIGLLLYSQSAFAIPHPQEKATEVFQFGIQKLQIGEYLEAIDDFTQAIKLKDDFAVAYSNRCLAYLQVEDYENAIADCNQAIYLVPNNLEAYLNRGLAYYRQEDYTTAIESDNQVIALKPADFRAYYNRGIATAAMGEYNHAIAQALTCQFADYNLALSLVPNIPNYSLAEIYNDLGAAQLHLTNFDAAKGNFSLAIRFNPDDFRAYFNRGCACGRNHDYQDAVRDFSRTIQLNPSHAQAYLNRGIAQHNLGYQQAALSDLKLAGMYFEKQNQSIAYERIADLIKVVQKQISLQSVIS
jgi:tetratricopeptide (TPR) repeat protein